MKRAAFVIAFLLTAVSCATIQQGSTAHVGRAVQVLAGAAGHGSVADYTPLAALEGK